MIANRKDENMKEEHASIFLLYVVVVISDTQQAKIVSTSEQSQAKLVPGFGTGPTRTESRCSTA